MSFLKDNAFVLLLFISLGVIIRPVLQAWHWGEDECQLFELSKQLKQDKTDFYTWLGVEPTATVVEIEKAHRAWVLEHHPETSTEPEATEQFKLGNQIALYLRSPTTRALYDRILVDGVPLWKGFYYAYTRYKLLCMVLLILLIGSCVEYVKAWDRYLTEKMALDHFVKNATSMAHQLSDRHASAMTHRSFIDMGDRTIQCEINSKREIFILEKGVRLPLDSVHLIQRPNVFNLTLFRMLTQTSKRLFYANRKT
ncbi:hypothetical protein EDC96DRAFT_578737 [Choanephora cucurbitarum]|nr:hypothetical protein EDC96DRAFT_578737 [Choanephora cucurbitarum]